MAYAIAAAWFLMAVLGHMVLMRMPVRGSSVARFVGAAGLAAIGLAVCVGISTWASIAALAAYAFACEFYVFLFTLVVSSVSVRILFLLQSGARRADEDGAAMVRRRLRRMVAVGLIAPAGNGFEVTAKGRSLLRVFHFLQAFFGHAAPVSETPSEPAWARQTSPFRPIDTFPRSNL
jgi:hypothetical protein